VVYLSHDNADQLATVRAAEKLIPPEGSYFDGIGMVPTRRMEPRLWLDAMEVRRTLLAGEDSSLSRALASNPPDVVIQSYRTTLLHPVLGESLREGYVSAGPNLLIRRDLRPDG